MRFKHKKLLISGTAVATAGALGVGALLQTVTSVQASSDMMPGIEQIVDENTEDAPFRILELVNSSEDAEIGYYISGQEPSLKLYQYQYTDSSGQVQTIHFTSVQDALSKLPAEQRQQFMQNGSVEEIKNVQDTFGDDGPLSYSEYQEKYFLDSGDTGWTKVDLTDFNGNARTDTVSVNGSYQENTSRTGDYTRSEQKYYPIRNDVQADVEQTEKYRENIQSFYPSDSGDSRGAYDLVFAEVENSKVNSELKKDKGQTAILPEYDYANGRYGYYKNVYTDLTKEIVDNINKANNGEAEYQFPEEKLNDTSDGVPIQDNTDEAVKSTITESNAFSSGETDDSSAESTEPSAQDEFSGNSESDTGSIDFDNAYQSDGEDSFESSDSDSFDSDISLEQQSYEQPVESSDEDVFSDDFSDQAVDSGDSSADAEMQMQEDTDSFDEDTPDIDSTEEAGDGTQQTTGQRAVLGEVSVKETAGTQENPYVYLAENIAEYPYYKYEEIGDLKYVEQKAADTAAEIQTNPDYQIKEGDILLDQDQYWYYKEENDTLQKYPVSIVTGREPVSFNELQQIPDDFDYNYYYRVKKVYFCCKSVDNETENPSACVYQGWYYPSYPANEDTYLPVNVEDGKTATHYTAEASYTLTPGIGNYDFVPGGENSCQVEVNSLYYQGGYENHDWFKKYVFHLTPKTSEDDIDGDFENFKIEVDTKSADDATDFVYAEAVTGSDTAAQSVASDEEAESIEGIDAESADGTQQNDASDEVDFSSEFSDTEIQDAGDSEETAAIAEEENGEDADASVQEDSEEDTEAEVDTSDENTDSEAEVQTEDSTEEDVSAEMDEETAADVGDGEADVENTLTDSLKEYDLIYLNGAPAAEVAKAIAEAGVPCIINSVKVADNAAFKDAFSTMINYSDDDDHYVNRNLYFYKNTDKTNTTGFVNQKFNTNFNKHTDSEKDLTYSGKDAMSGFEEVIKYINSENRYRKVQAESESSDALDSGESTDGSVQTQSVSLLSREISQARAIEYIINYQYKRTIVTKDSVNVLEVMPDVNGYQLTKDDVLSWINAEDRIEKVTPCCEDEEVDTNPQDYGRTFVAENLRDGDPNTFWHTRWQKDENGGYHTADNPPFITVEFKEPEVLDGFIYQARPYTTNAGHVNGVLFEYKVELYNEKNDRIYEETGETGIKTDSSEHQNPERKLKFGETVSGVKTMKIVFVKSGSSAEHTGEVSGNSAAVFGSCAELGVLYADDYEERNLDVNIDVMTASEFVGHIDDLGAEYDIIYFDDSLVESKRNIFITGNAPMLYTHVGGEVSAEASVKSDKRYFTRFMGQMDSEYLLTESGERAKDEAGRYYLAPVNTYSETGGGYFRGSGNDLTDQMREKLINFVKSGYPVILGSKLVTGSGDDRAVNKDVVDASSYYYQFFKEALDYSNVITKKELTDKTKDITFFANLTKPQITFTEKPLEVPRAGEVDNGTDTGWIQNSELKYVFSIANDSDLAPLTSTYDCKLYLDLNLDGNMSEQEAQDDYITITDSSGNVLTPQDGRYQLKLKETYTLTRKIPADYYKLITWKLVVSSNTNTDIHTSSQGYARQKNNTGEKQTIKVLQIKPDSGGTWTLKGNAKFKEYLDKVEDFNIEIEDMKVSAFEKLSDVSAELDKYQVLIFGFDDVYQDISNDNGQVDAIKAYIQSGRSVIFAHDTTSYSNYTYTTRTDLGKKTTIHPRIAATEYGVDEDYEIFYDGWMDGKSGGPYNPSWGSSFNTVLRSIMGMDRYGITSDAQLSEGGETISQLLKKGKELNSSQVDYATLLKYAGDAAFKSGDETRSSSYAQTQALTNGLLSQRILAGDDNTNTVTKVNDGAITQYPYRLGDEPLTVSTTASQYYQLALEQDYDSAGRSDGESDIVVWYCLSEKPVFTESPNDVRNYYYYYSKGNVIFCGSGHTAVNNNENETKLLINSIVAAANVTAVEPEVSFVKSLSPTAEKEISRYYMTDQSSWTAEESNVLEKDMTYYINVRDYNMVSTDLGQTNQGKKEMTVQFYIDDATGSQVEGCPATGNVTDITASIGTLTGFGNIGEVQVGNDRKFHLTQNTAYGLQISDIENYLRSQSGNKGYKESCKIYVKVTSTVSLYGKEYEGSSWASIDLKQRQLFEMD